MRSAQTSGTYFYSSWLNMMQLPQPNQHLALHRQKMIISQRMHWKNHCQYFVYDGMGCTSAGKGTAATTLVSAESHKGFESDGDHFSSLSVTPLVLKSQ